MSTGFDLDATDVKEFDDVELGGNLPAAGIYHAMVKAAEEMASKEKGTPGYRVHFEILAGTVPGQESKEISETFWLTEKTLPRLKKFALATRVLREGQKMSGDDFLNGVAAHQVVIEVEDDTYEKNGEQKTSRRLAYAGFWPVNHKDQAAVPKCKEAMAMLGPDGRPKAEAQAAVAAAAGGGDDEWANI